MTGSYHLLASSAKYLTECVRINHITNYDISRTDYSIEFLSVKSYKITFNFIKKLF